MVAGALTLGLTVRLSAQHVLAAEHGGKMYVVDKVRRDWVSIQQDGKVTEVRAKRCALIAVEEYLPAFVAVKDIEVKTTGTTKGINNTFHFRARFESPFVLTDVFVVLELKLTHGGTVLFYRDVGMLAPGRPGFLRADLPLSRSLGSGEYELHVFSRGLEVFHSQQPWQYREEMLDRMVIKRIAGVEDANPQPLVAPAPEYPAALLKSGGSGEAAVSVRVSVKGVVLDAVVESATGPMFGEAALTAIRQWRFLPRVKNGEAVEMQVSVPFAFTPPKRTVAGRN